jgi:hypothetical protein
VALCLALATIRGADGQSLQRLTVQSFDLSSDTTVPRENVPFHLILRLRVRERVTQIGNLDLPMLAQLELLGDERETTAAQRGTQYLETISVVSHAAGPLAIAPATLQAIDARDGKAKQWSTNGLSLMVIGPPVHLSSGVTRYLFWLLGLTCILLIAFVLFRRRSPSSARIVLAPPPVAPLPPAVVTRSRRQQAEDALAVLRAERSRAAAVSVRAAIWRMAGASDGETLADVLRRPDADELSMRLLLIALERSAFTYDADLSAAIDDACGALDRYIETAA